jgi:hypothetical protein
MGQSVVGWLVGWLAGRLAGRSMVLLIVGRRKHTPLPPDHQTQLLDEMFPRRCPFLDRHNDALTCVWIVGSLRRTYLFEKNLSDHSSRSLVYGFKTPGITSKSCGHLGLQVEFTFCWEAVQSTRTPCRRHRSSRQSGHLQQDESVTLVRITLRVWLHMVVNFHRSVFYLYACSVFMYVYRLGLSKVSVYGREHGTMFHHSGPAHSGSIYYVVTPHLVRRSWDGIMGSG